MAAKVVKHDLLQKIWHWAKTQKQHKRYILKYYQKQKAMNDCLAPGVRVLKHRNI